MVNCSCSYHHPTSCRVVYNLDEEVSEDYTDFISPLHDHTRVSFTIGDSIWGNIPSPRLEPSPEENKTKTRLKMEDIVPHLTTSTKSALH